MIRLLELFILFYAGRSFSHAAKRDYLMGGVLEFYAVPCLKALTTMQYSFTGNVSELARRKQVKTAPPVH